MKSLRVPHLPNVGSVIWIRQMGFLASVFLCCLYIPCNLLNQESLHKEKSCGAFFQRMRQIRRESFYASWLGFCWDSLTKPRLLIGLYHITSYFEIFRNYFLMAFLGYPWCLLVTLWTVAHQAPPSMEFSRQEYWSGFPFPSPGNIPDPAIEPAYPVTPALQANSSPIEPLG